MDDLQENEPYFSDGRHNRFQQLFLQYIRRVREAYHLDVNTQREVEKLEQLVRSSSKGR